MRDGRAARCSPPKPLPSCPPRPGVDHGSAHPRACPCAWRGAPRTRRVHPPHRGQLRPGQNPRWRWRWVCDAGTGHLTLLDNMPLLRAALRAVRWRLPTEALAPAICTAGQQAGTASTSSSDGYDRLRVLLRGAWPMILQASGPHAPPGHAAGVHSAQQHGACCWRVRRPPAPTCLPCLTGSSGLVRCRSQATPPRWPPPRILSPACRPATGWRPARPATSRARGEGRGLWR